MLPHNRLGRQMASKLRVYAGADHRHEAQMPQALAPGEFPRWSGLPEAATTEKAAPKTRPEPKAPAAKPTTAKRTTATSPAQEDDRQAFDGQDAGQAHHRQGHDRQAFDGEVHGQEDDGQEDDGQAHDEEGDVAWCRPRRDDARRPSPGSA